MNFPTKPALVALGIVLAASGCARREAVRPGAESGILRISQRNEPSDLDPALASLPDDFFVIRALGEGLVVPDPGGGSPIPAAARSWETSPDGLTWTFHLREGARWSNGDEVTAADFLYSLRRVLAPSTAAPKADLLFPIRNARAFAAGRITDFGQVGLRAQDALTLVVTLERPTPGFLLYAASGPWIPVDPAVVQRLGRDWTRPGNHVGNGPFVLEDWRHGQFISVRRNPLYRAASDVRLAGVRFLRFDDGDTEERAYRGGEIDVTMSVPTARLDAYAKGAGGDLHHAPLAETRYLAFNTRRAPLDDPRVRRALSLAVDRGQLVAFVLKGGQEPARSLLPPQLLPGAPGEVETPVPGRAAELAQARSLLAAAGYGPGARAFPTLELSGWGNTPVLEAIQAMWRDGLGISVGIVNREARAHEASLRSGSFDIGFITLIPDIAEPFSLLERFTTRSAENYPHFSDPAYDALVEAGLGTEDPALRARMARSAESRLAELCPAAPLYFNAHNWLMRPFVRGWREDGMWTRSYGGIRLEGGGDAPQPGGTLRVGNYAEPQGLDPQVASGVPEHRIISALFEGLATEDPVDLHPVPGLASSWDVSSDGLLYTFHLREGIRWSDGTPITAQDFVDSYRRMLTPALAAEYAYLLYNYVAGGRDYYEGRTTDFSTVGFGAPDGRTLTVRLAHPTPFLLKIIASHDAWDVVPVRVIARCGPLERKDNPWTRPENLVCTGPFRLEEWRSGRRISVVRNPAYWDGARVRLDRIEFYPVEDVPTEERMFRSGQLDITASLPGDKIGVYRREHPGELRIEPWLGIYFYRCNTTRPPLNDRRVRRALALAIDRDAIVRDVVRGGERPALAVSYPGTSGYTPRARLEGDLAEARRLLAEAGYPGGRGFPELELLYNTQQANRAIAEAIDQMWRRNLGVGIRLRNEEWKVYLDSEHTMNYQIERSGWIADYADPHVFLEIWETGNGNNSTGWSNARYDRLLHEALAARNQEGRYEIYQQMDQILVDECPVLPIFYYTRFYAMSPSVGGWWPNLLDNHPWKYVRLGRSA
jgi:oligopeptide transport system substrate-binding protein